MSNATALRLFNTLTKTKDDFAPIDAKNVRLYVCGPTVYDFAHIGNARPVIVFDVLFRLLRHTYGDAHVTYVRNITDVDDKINERAAQRGISIRELTEETARIYEEDVAALGNLPPSVTPRATEHIAQMIAMIEQLIAAGHAYAAQGHVLFNVSSKSDYGKLSRRSVDEMLTGARVEVAPYKQNAMDFVLWKPSEASLPGWDSPWGRGRPGWHIECSAMAGQYLGETFDIHGGGIDLQFPHHENEIAQSEGAHHGHPLAKLWMHNGFLQVEGEKMSKSAGNFFTIRDLLADWPGEVLRFNMLRTHYRQPIDFTFAGLKESWKTLERWYEVTEPLVDPAPDGEFFAALADDLNTPAAIASLHQADEMALAGGLGFLGFSNVQLKIASKAKVDTVAIADAIAARNAARKAKDFQESDRIRDEWLAKGIVFKDGPQGTTWEIKK
ncbi:MAG: cysteine--tRNA ligase [Alphaproteobacteria bacterium]|nr:cysteine--tRNA ligase [Alphaproteobacteria bacterium]